MPVPPEGSFLHCPAAAFGRTVCRLGLASRIGHELTEDDIHFALGRGVESRVGVFLVEP